jgi:hypothetical protein
MLSSLDLVIGIIFSVHFKLFYESHKLKAANSPGTITSCHNLQKLI